MSIPFKQQILLSLFIGFFSNAISQASDSIITDDPRPIFKNGEAQVVPEFSDKDDWIKEELWVESSFDSDGDGKLDRMHVFVTRPSQTSSGKLKLPVIYMSSPYYGLKLKALLGCKT